MTGGIVNSPEAHVRPTGTGPLSLAAFLDVAVEATQSLTQSHLKGEALGMAGIAGLIPPGRLDPQWLLGEDYIYTAPERLHGSTVNQDAPSSDLYALGILFYQILTGRRPFDAVGRAEWRHAHLAIEPRPPSAFIASLPPLIDAIVLRLLNKDPADRYISAEALYVDLAACASALNSKGSLPWFEPGASEAPFRFDKTDGLLQHSEQVRQIEAVIGRVSREGEHAMAFVSGPGGIGKTSLVHYAIKATGAASASGKSDKLQRDKPYDSVAQVLRILFNRLLSAGEDEIEGARTHLLQQLEGHGRAIVDLVPEAEAVLGPTPPLAEVSAQTALSRTQNAVCRVLELFAASARPLVLFFDDLQWADDLTLGVIGALISRAPKHLCVIGAYRDGDEITAELARLIELARSGQSPFTERVVNPLSIEDTRRAIRASLPGNVPQMDDIGEMIHRRTSGNPFFINQLLRTLLETGAIRFDPLSESWSWQPDGAKGAATPRDIASFMAEKLAGLPPETRHLVRHMACVGRTVNTDLLCALMAVEPATLRRQIRPLIDSGLLVEETADYAFVHDRVFEAAYGLSTDPQRSEVHARIADLLLAQPSSLTDDGLFDIANHIERANPEALSPDQKGVFAQALYDAATAVRQSGGIVQAKRYLSAAMRLMSETWWQASHALTFNIHVAYAEILLADAQTQAAAEVITLLLQHAQSGIEEAAARRFQAHYLTLQSDYDAAIDVALIGLKSLGISLERYPSAETIDRAYARVQQALGGRPVAALSELAPMSDPQMQSAMALLSTLISSIFTTDGLRFVHLATIVELSIRHGVTPESAYGLGWYGPMIAAMYDAYEDGYAYSQVALELVETHGYDAQRTSALTAVDQICVWKQPMSYALTQVYESISAADKAGDAGMICYARNHLISDLLVMGVPLWRVAEDLTPSLALTRKFGYRDIELLLSGQQHLVHSLMNTGHEVAPDLASHGNVAVTTRFWVNLYLGIADYWLGRFDSSVSRLAEASGLTSYLLAHIDTAWCDFFLALALAAQTEDEISRPQALQKIAPLRDKFAKWVNLNPLTFENKLFLIDAEIARLSGQDLRALSLYEHAAFAAEKAGFIHEQALAHERAGRLLFAAGIRSAAAHHTDIAADIYAQWGAAAKTSQLAQEFGAAVSRQDRPLATDDGLDMSLALRTSQALSEEILLDNLVRSLMRDMIVHAGADFGTLIMMRGGMPVVEASGTITDGKLSVKRETGQESAPVVPATILNTVKATRKAFLLADARTDFQGLHGSVTGARSILCVPIVRRGDLTGVVYLENNLAGGVFAPARIAMIELLASQAAISLENATLYAELVQENERRARSEAALLTARAELARTSQLTTLGGLAASIAHEINQPLSAIASHADASRRWLERPRPDLPNALKGVESIRAGVDRVTKIIQALRSIARQVPQTFEEMAVDPMIRHVLHLTEAEAVMSEISVTTRLGSEEYRVMGDRTQLEQVMLNLITNAVDAMVKLPAHRRKLEIESFVEEAQVTVAVRDNGPGIPAAVRDALFDPLVTTKASGMGMGLAICKSIVEAHRGVLSVESRETGAAFSFSIPVASKRPDGH